VFWFHTPGTLQWQIEDHLNHGGGTLRARIRGCAAPDGVVIVRVFVPEALMTQGVYAAWAVLGSLTIGLVGLAVVLADRLGRTFVRPMQQLRDTAHRLREGDLLARAEPQGPGEVREVATALNGLADRIDDLVAAERESAADLSHRLRTPVTALRLDVERLRAGSHRDQLISEVAAVEAAIDEVIRAARSRSTNPPTEPADLAGATRARLAFWSVLATNQHRKMTVLVADTPCPIALAPEALDAAIDALIGNVFAHTPPGTALRVEVQQPSAGRAASLIVEDEGPGLVDIDLIERGASGAGSTGLGLDIARRTAEATGGHLVLGTAAGGATRVELVLGAGPRATRRSKSLVSRR
jgi:signal transduction histidine kinase